VATSKSALKRIRQNERDRLRNKAMATSLKTLVKKLHEAVAAKDLAAAEKALKATVVRFDKAGAKGIVHPNNVARNKSRLTQKVNALRKAAAQPQAAPATT